MSTSLPPSHVIMISPGDHLRRGSGFRSPTSCPVHTPFALSSRQNRFSEPFLVTTDACLRLELLFMEQP
eukprot:2195755-Pyramimonas_sp.AAC.1